LVSSFLGFLRSLTTLTEHRIPDDRRRGFNPGQPIVRAHSRSAVTPSKSYVGLNTFSIATDTVGGDILGRSWLLMSSLTLSLWLPVLRANFFSFTSRTWLNQCQIDDHHFNCSSRRLDDPAYTPLLYVPVMRRLLEVMPRSFHYGPEGRCRVSGTGELVRPTGVVLQLDLTVGTTGAGDTPGGRANALLRAAGVSKVELYADENGNYSFTAYFVSEESQAKVEVRRALIRHIREVFGGEFIVHPVNLSERKRFDAGDASVKRYNGLLDDSLQPMSDPLPRGALSFFQLNTLAEGLWNDILSPAVYLELDDFLLEYSRRADSVDALRSVADVIEALTTEFDAREPLGQILTLNHFLTLSAHGSLHKLKEALESVRRRLLEEMMQTVHRQNRLIQLNFSDSRPEWTPEFAAGASESQLRGYATLMAAKLPLIINVREVATLAVAHLHWLIESSPDSRAREEGDMLTFQLSRLDGQFKHWEMLLEDLMANVKSLEDSVQHAWMDRLLFEQKQVRSEQEAIAEVERSRNGRPPSQQVGRAAYNFIMLVLAALAVAFTVYGTDIQRIGTNGTTWWELAWSLRAIWLFAIVAAIVMPVGGHLWRTYKDRRGKSSSYPYEFAFWLDEEADAANVPEFLNPTKRLKIDSSVLPKLSIVDQGYSRSERVSADTNLVKARSVVAFRVSRFQFARFEVLTEISIHKIASRAKYNIVQLRIFGESPRPLRAAEVGELIEAVLRRIGSRIARDQSIDLDLVLEKVANGEGQAPGSKR
jgi:hypothetical protein